MNTKLEVPTTTMAQIVNYLITKPFSEVAHLMQLINSTDVKEIQNVNSD